MLSWFFHGWERRCVAVTKDRVVRPFEWGLDWIAPNGHAPGVAPERVLGDWVERAMADTDTFFAAPPTAEYSLADNILMFPSALATPHAVNNIVHARYFPARAGRNASATRHARRAVVVLPQWNADPEGHAGLCRLLSAFGLSALRLSLPYHDQRMPPELHRADYIVSSNVARTVQVCRQAVVDTRRAVHWLARQGYESIGILGTSLGSCIALLASAHEPLLRAQALNHISPFFADVVWEGLSTQHVRAGLDGHIELERLRALWRPISPYYFLDRVRDKKTLLLYARYDLTFPVRLSRLLVGEFERRQIPHELAVLPCGHYTTGRAPFKYLDGWVLARFLSRNL